MADVRSLLRNELASRKGTSPNTTGNRVTKKRKVDNNDGVMRKKLRSTSLESVTPSDAPADPSPRSVEDPTTSEILEPVEEDGVAGPDLPVDEVEEDPALSQQPSDQAATTSAPTQEVPGTVDEDEWAAFEREVAEPSRMPEAPAALSAAATISAAPVSADELAVQQEKDNATTSRTREAELEGDREDAARFMEEEFDEMDQLEERVRRLKHMREELREKRARDEAQDRPMVSEEPRAEESDSDDDDEDEDWDDWRFK
ncbi:uncharacterized protein N7503_010465 [Penicillium pulvis]|uniref:uncharacterized protein n=1 Tax=Penicillium pulvis TaxID=1562058 RepID=UPI002547D08B|nr:uncharacterized protein N7503_010465 [Penicillium pulvis]KAJ5785253.1 hypothetical protein N7503_010465 [Penicillium pulvis]